MGSKPLVTDRHLERPTPPTTGQSFPRLSDMSATVEVSMFETANR
jgi:hypothetical protein